MGNLDTMGDLGKPGGGPGNWTQLVV